MNRHTGKPPGDGAIDLWGHHIALVTQLAVVAALLLAAGYLLLFPRVAGKLRRLGLSALIAGTASAVYVGYHDHAHHPSVVAAAAARGDTVPRVLLAGWAGLAVGGTVALFAASTWWLAKRRQGRFQFRWLRRRGRRDTGTVYMPAPGTGRPPGRMPGMPPGYEADDPYAGFPPGFRGRR